MTPRALIVGAVLALTACGVPEAQRPVPTPPPAIASPGPSSAAAPTPVQTATTAAPAPPPAEPGAQRRLDADLLAAAYANDVEEAERLVGVGADVNAKDASEQSAFLIATSEVGDDPRLLDLTVAHGADLASRDSFNGTGLIRAAERGFPVIVERLLDRGIEVDHVNELGWTALHEAIILGTGGRKHTAVVRLLVAAGADVMLPSQADGVRPVEHAERLGHRQITSILRKAARTMTPDSRLLRAASGGSTVAAEAAIADGADIEARDERQRTPLLLAVTDDHVGVARLLVDRGADVNAIDDQRDTPFLVTGVTGSVEMLDALLPGGPDTTLTNRYGGVAVIPASERGHADYVEAVLDRTDIDVNHVNDLGWTALLEAVILGDGGRRHQRVVASLLAHGADPSIADNDGVTPLEHARRGGQGRVVRLLERASSP